MQPGVYEIFKQLFGGQPQGVAKQAFLIQARNDLQALSVDQLIAGHVRLYLEINQQQEIAEDPVAIERQINLIPYERLRAMTMNLLDAEVMSAELYRATMLQKISENIIINALQLNNVSEVTRENVAEFDRAVLLSLATNILQAEADRLVVQGYNNRVKLVFTETDVSNVVFGIKAALIGIVEQACTLIGPVRAEYLLIWVNAVKKAQTAYVTTEVNHIDNAIIYRNRTVMSIARHRPHTAQLPPVTATQIQTMNNSALLVAMHRSGVLRELSENQQHDVITGRKDETLCDVIAQRFNNKVTA